MDDNSIYSLDGETAEEVYGRTAPLRQQVIDTARDMAELTIPALFPPEGYKAGDRLPGNNQSIGAHLVNVLTSHMMFMAFPPGQPIVRFDPKEYELQQQIDDDPELWARTQLALSRLEIAHRKRFAATSLASTYTMYIKGLLVGGNMLWKQLRLEEPSCWGPESYIVKRTQGGHPVLAIQKEKVTLQAIDKDHAAFIRSTDAENKGRGQPGQNNGKAAWEETADVYSVLKLLTDDKGERSWAYWEEYGGKVIPDTEVETDYDTPPMWPGWLIPVFGDDWGRGYCEEYRGDLYSLEALSSSLNDGAAAMALFLMFVAPGSQTSIKAIRNAKNLSVHPGNAADVTVFRSDKGADLNFVANHLALIAERLGAAFLLQSSIQRSGERVTKEEIVRVGTELDKALGGLYTQVAQGNQKVIIMRSIRLHEDENKKLPELPKGLISVEVVTGLDALGDSTEADSLIETGSALQALFPQQWQKEASIRDFANRLYAARGIKPDGLMKSAEAVAQDAENEKQQMLQQSLVDKGAGPVAKGLTDMAVANQGGDASGGGPVPQQ